MAEPMTILSRPTTVLARVAAPDEEPLLASETPEGRVVPEAKLAVKRCELRLWFKARVEEWEIKHTSALARGDRGSRVGRAGRGVCSDGLALDKDGGAAVGAVGRRGDAVESLGEVVAGDERRGLVEGDLLSRCALNRRVSSEQA
jgi:hypothetical protein